MRIEPIGGPSQRGVVEAETPAIYANLEGDVSMLRNLASSGLEKSDIEFDLFVHTCDVMGAHGLGLTHQRLFCRLHGTDASGPSGDAPGDLGRRDGGADV